MLLSLVVVSVLGHARTGAYTADGGTQRITGLGFRPDVVLLKNDGSGSMVISTAAMPLGTSRHFTNPDPTTTQEIDSLDPDGFSVGDAGWVSRNANVRWLALEGPPSVVAVGSYLGDGTNGRQISTAPLAPALVMVVAANAPAVHATVAMPSGTAQGLGTDTGGPGLISALTPTGFVVESMSRTNGSGATYYWLALAALPGRWAFGSLVGDGGTQAFDAGFTPVFVSIKAPTITGLFRIDDTSSGYGAPWGAGSVGGGTLKLTANGFTLDSSSQYAVGGVSFTWFAISAGPDTLLVAPDAGNGSNVWFDFVSNVPGSIFECRLDGAAFAACMPPHILSPVAGPHHFEARAIDVTGAIDATPATFDWTTGGSAGGAGGSSGGAGGGSAGGAGGGSSGGGGAGGVSGGGPVVRELPVAELGVGCGCDTGELAAPLLGLAVSALMRRRTRQSPRANTSTREPL